ncbi:MAG: 50S ribosomal protein L4 [Bacteroidia bacterium]|nr:50S ribosomal protein L4 [Bacteroidia bacterium]MDW8159604.1 50S ribosomal protein L4 [Bacteroidia bacterium]
MQLPVFNFYGQETGEIIELDDNLFNCDPNDHVIYLDVKQYWANQRQGTHKTKERGEVSGSTRKPYRQKGTGNARAGHIRSPLWRHGGTIFGPRPRSYSFKLNKKVKILARQSAFSYKAREQKLLILENFELSAPRSKEVIQLLQNLKLNGVKILFITPQPKSNLYFSARNIPKVEVKPVSELHTYNIVNVEQVIILKDSISGLEKFLGKS